MKKYVILSAFLATLEITSGAAKAAVIVNTNNEPYCREYTQNFTVGNATERGYGTACLQPDGSWEIQNPATTTTQIVPTSVIIRQAPITYVIRDKHTYVVPTHAFRQKFVVQRNRHHHGKPHNNRW